MELTKKQFIEDFKRTYFSQYATEYNDGNTTQQYHALGTILRTYAFERWQTVRKKISEEKQKQVYYFSIEFLTGKFLVNNAFNLRLLEVVKEGLADLDIDFEAIVDAEAEPAIGNGGLGRLAACYLESGASLGLPLHGNGIRYQNGLFKQKFVDGHQVELPDNWLQNPNPWEIRNTQGSVVVNFGGNVYFKEESAGLTPVYENAIRVLAVPYDTPSIGYDNATVNNLRLWNAEPLPDEEEMLTGKQRQRISEISQTLYPDDSTPEGKRLRLIQEYFFVSAGVQSIIREFKRRSLSRNLIPDNITIQINDTHPALVIPELMRILLDEERLSWDKAWEITHKTVAYTNHTVLREALETWPIDMFKDLLPRMYQIISEIDRRYETEMIPVYGNELTHSTRIIKDGTIHMANLAIIGSFSVNGVASLHTDILKNDVLNDFYEISPQKFNNKTNGITHRRFLQVSNNDLSELITSQIGKEWKLNPNDLTILKGKKEDKSFLKKLREVKTKDKKKLAEYVRETMGVELNTDAMFDVLIKRLHAYKRQHMQLLHIIDRYLRIKAGGDVQPRVFIFGAKAAPSYRFAKNVIKVINELSYMINADESVNDKLQVVFIPNYNVSLSEIIIPAAELSEQISLAGKEASGTGNMKMMTNGALTMATLDGANVEINELVGDENMFLFGMTADEVSELNSNGTYNPRKIYENDEHIQKILNTLIDGTIPNVADEGQAIFDELVNHGDEYYVLQDLPSFLEAQEKADELYQKSAEWMEKSLYNIASSGSFSADYAVSRYAEEIWRVKPVDEKVSIVRKQ